jgi:molecular chaperone HtpG
MKKSVSATNVKVSNNIPEDLVFSILSKLPLKSLKRFGCVRKSWAFLFENLHFMTMYRNYFLSNNHSYYDGTSILLNHTNNPLPGDAFYDTLYILSGERFEIMVKLDWPPPFDEDDRFIDILSQTSVNGTLCLAKDCDPKCVFWNPTTDEFKVIPPSPFLSQLSQSRYVDPIVYFNGFGYDRVRDDYKVIRWLSYYPITDVDEPWDEDLSLDNTGVDEPKEKYLDVDRMWEIYSLRSNSWRKLDIEMPCRHANEKLYMDGVCHWWSILDGINCYEVEPRLVSFDLCNEVCLTTPLPSDIIERYDLLHLTLLNGSIAFIIYDETTTFHIRILGEFGVKESWVEVFVVEPLPGIERPIGAGKNGHIFFRKDDNEIVWFDLSTQMIEELGVKGNKYYGCHIIIYKDTLLPTGGL